MADELAWSDDYGSSKAPGGGSMTNKRGSRSGAALADELANNRGCGSSVVTGGASMTTKRGRGSSSDILIKLSVVAIFLIRPVQTNFLTKTEPLAHVHPRPLRTRTSSPDHNARQTTLPNITRSLISHNHQETKGNHDRKTQSCVRNTMEGR